MKKKYIFPFLFISVVWLSFIFTCNQNSDEDDDNDTIPNDDDNTIDDDNADEGKIETWKDTSTGLIWEKLPPINYRSWYDALAYCDHLDGPEINANNWRLPTISELRSLIRNCPNTQTGGACGVTDECLDWFECKDASCDFCGRDPKDPIDENECLWPIQIGGVCGHFWSSSVVQGQSDDLGRWVVEFVGGTLLSGGLWNNQANEAPKSASVRCVRTLE